MLLPLSQKNERAITMELRDITVTKIGDVYTVYSERGKSSRVNNRRSYGISFCTEGQVTYIQNGREYVSTKESAVILPKGGSYFVQKDKVVSCLVINFECNEPLCDAITLIPLDNADELISDYNRIKKLLCFSGSRAQIFSIFYSMLDKLSSSGIPHELFGAMRLIRSDYCDASLTNARLAAECYISEVYFRKLFKRHFGISPKQFIIDMRIQKAKQLLSENLLSTSAISESCGFSSAYHFSRLFRQHTGITPSEYRKENMIYEI